METAAFVDAMQIVELTSTRMPDVIRELVGFMNCEDKGLSFDDVVTAIEERESTAQTLVDEGLALPHAIVDWDGDFWAALGRSREGIRCGTTTQELHLVILIVFGKGRERIHLEVLAAIGQLMKERDFRHELINARDEQEIGQLLLLASRRSAPRQQLLSAMPDRSVAVLEQALALAERLSAQAVMISVDRVESSARSLLQSWNGRLLIITASNSGNDQELARNRANTHLFEVPHTGLSRMDRANLGLLFAAAEGVVDHDREIVCVTGRRGQGLDSITVMKTAAHFKSVFPCSQDSTSTISPAVILRVLSLAIELASEGREAHPIGATFVIGDTRQVVRHTQQLVLNPFYGFSRSLRNILDPSLAETIKEFAFLDGAFIIEANGLLRSAGTYLIPESHVSGLPGGLGARHQAAAAITKATNAIAVTISQSTGTVTLFQDGGIVLLLERASLTRW